MIFAAMDCDPGYDNTYINGWLTLFDAAGTTLVNVDDTQATTTSRTPSTGTLTATTPSPPAEALAYQVASTGLYYLRVRSNTTAPSADYLLGVGLNCQPAQADLAVSQTAIPNPVRAGNQLTSTIQLDNNGGTTAQNASFNIFTSTFEYFVSLGIAGPSGWSCTTPAVGTSGTITCSNPCLPRSASAGPTVFTLVTRIDCQIPSGIVHAVAGSSITPDPNSANNNNNLSISVQSCNDGNACTDDVCSPANGCQFLPNANACNDLNPCTTNDVCSNGTCAGTPVPPPAEVDNSLTLTKNAFGWARLDWTDLTGPMFNIYRGLDGPAGWAYNQACWVGGIGARPPRTPPCRPRPRPTTTWFRARTPAGSR